MSFNNLAEIVDTAALNAQAIEQLSLQHQFNVDESYVIQSESIKRRYERGEKLIGLKMGFTSEAKMKQMDVHDMIWGRLTDSMLINNGGEVAFDQFIHPRAEPEICFLIKNKIDRELTLAEAKNHTEAVAAALEIIDSRYQNFKFSLEDVIADNCSSAGFVIGPWHPHNMPIDNLKMVMEIDNVPVQIGSSSAILGNPWKSLVAATRLAAQYEQEIPEGSYIMAGAATSAVYLKQGQKVKAIVEHLGAVEFSVS